MNPLCSAYIRAKTREAMIAGMQDALGEMVPGSPSVMVRLDAEGLDSIWTFIQNMVCQAVQAGIGDALGRTDSESNSECDHKPLSIAA